MFGVSARRTVAQLAANNCGSIWVVFGQSGGAAEEGEGFAEFGNQPV